ncbi:MAG: hypothetical protein NVS3B26_04740 [Mycobacteriales bacterium]
MVAMSAVSVAVALASLQSSQHGLISSAVNASAPAGLVASTDAPTAAPPPGSSSPRPLRAASALPMPATTAPRLARGAMTTTVNGAPAATQYGPVQVQISIRNHHILRANAIDYPQGSSRDQDINSQAIPQLDQEALKAQSSQIDTVSGASYTSDGYRQSLQSALDAAHHGGAW